MNLKAKFLRNGKYRNMIFWWRNLHFNNRVSKKVWGSFYICNYIKMCEEHAITHACEATPQHFRIVSKITITQILVK